jgi:hypothetical protein
MTEEVMIEGLDRSPPCRAPSERGRPGSISSNSYNAMVRGGLLVADRSAILSTKAMKPRTREIFADGFCAIALGAVSCVLILALQWHAWLLYAAGVCVGFAFSRLVLNSAEKP